MIEDFFHLPPMSTTPVVHLELRISPRIFEKIRNGPISILRGLGETDFMKKPEVENLVTLSLEPFYGFSFRHGKLYIYVCTVYFRKTVWTSAHRNNLQK
jgi:hypothetical protein